MRRTATCAGIFSLHLVGIWGITGPIVHVDAFIPEPSRVRHVHVRRQTTHIAPPRREDSAATTTAGWECRANRGGDDDSGVTTYYNDDAFGLVFLTASLVVRDFSFAAAFLLLSAVAASLSNVNVVANSRRFQPLIPGLVAFAALAASKIEPFAVAAQSLGGDFVVPLDEQGSQIELIVCSISLVWGIIQQVRSGGDKGS